MIGHLLNRTVQVWRPVTTADGFGGFDVEFVHVADVRAKVDQPTADERREADQWGAEHTHTVRFLPDADVARGDELRGDGQVLRVLATVTNSRRTYLRAVCQLVESEPSASPLLFPGTGLFPGTDLFPIGV